MININVRVYVVVTDKGELYLMDVRDMAWARSDAHHGKYNGAANMREVWYYGGWRADDPMVIPTMRLATIKYELVDTIRDNRGDAIETVHDLVIFDRAGQEIDRARYRLEVTS